MSDKSNKYGYLTDVPQSFGNNKGVFSVNEVYDLTRADKYTNYGQLELIETQTSTSSTTAINFESIGDYDTYYLSFIGDVDGTGYQYWSLRFGNSGTYIATGYQYHTAAYDSSTSNHSASSSGTELRIGTYSKFQDNGYAYIHNIRDENKSTFVTGGSVAPAGNSKANAVMSYASGTLPNATSYDCIQILRSFSVSWGEGFRTSLYGIKRA
jgi:hypothetical protein